MVMFLLGAAYAPAQETPPAGEPAAAQLAAPIPVYIGMYVNRIECIDLKQGCFTADFWVWFRWKDESVKPLETFDVANGQVESKEGIASEPFGGWQYMYCRIRATIFESFNLAGFPFDGQRLSICIEDGMREVEEFQYIPDRESCRLDPGIALQGWKIKDVAQSVTAHKYTSNFGDPSIDPTAGASYSRFEFTIDVEREGSAVSLSLKFFWTLFVSVLIALLTLFIKPTDVDPRFGLSVGGLFAAVAGSLVVASSLPDTACLTVADKVNALGIATILIVMLESVVSLRLAEADRQKLSAKIDIVSFVVLLVLFSVAALLLIAT
ncbi:MAG: hypothetical protein RDV41_03275 [Planctomycetota bacterium]|nr:hypothetical protein [Planctomycetota bacterium]